MNKILGIDSAYTSAVEHRGNNMVISANLVSEMVDRIRELELGGWVSVEDRLPNIDTEVLIINSEGVEIAQLINAVPDGSDYMGSDAGFIGQYAMPGRSSGADAYRHSAQGQPTHWMPLPSPPLNEEQG